MPAKKLTTCVKLRFQIFCSNVLHAVTMPLQLNGRGLINQEHACFTRILSKLITSFECYILAYYSRFYLKVEKRYTSSLNEESRKETTLYLVLKKRAHSQCNIIRTCDSSKNRKYGKSVYQNFPVLAITSMMLLISSGLTSTFVTVSLK